MALKDQLTALLKRFSTDTAPHPADLLRATGKGPTNAAGVNPPTFRDVDATPAKMTEVLQPDGRLSQYPPPEHWDDHVEWDGKAWPRKVARRYSLVPASPNTIQIPSDGTPSLLSAAGHSIQTQAVQASTQ